MTATGTPALITARTARATVVVLPLLDLAYLLPRERNLIFLRV